MNPQQPNITALIPLGPQGQLLDPVSFLLFFLFLPIRIITEIVNASGAAVAQSVAVIPHVPFPVITPSEQDMGRSKIIEAPSYTIRSAETPAASQPAATYENEERCEIVWNKDGLPTEIIIHRKAIRT